MTGRITAMTLGQGLTVRTELDPDRQPFLHDHRIDGTPVLPGVMGMEAFAEAARVLLAGWQVVALEDVDLLAPVKFYRDEPRTLELHALIRDGGDGTMVADCELVGRRPLPGQGEQETRPLHGPGPPEPHVRESAPQGDTPESAAAGRAVVGHAEVYRVYFHGPAYQVLESAWRENGHVIGTLAGRPAARARAGRAGDRVPAAADRAVLPDRRGLGARHDRPDVAAERTSTASCATPARTSPAHCGPW